MKKLFILATVLLVAGGSMPAWADDDEDGSSWTFDLRYAYELGSWKGVTATGGDLSFQAPMHTFTVTDRDGFVGALLLSLAGTEANRRTAEQAAIRNHEHQYSYAVQQTKPNPGLQLGMTLGTGTTSGLPGDAPTAKLFKVAASGDLWSFLGGTLNFDTHVAMFDLQAPATATSSTAFSALSMPLGLGYRWAVPLPLLNLVVEPRGEVDLRYLFSGLKAPALYGYGVMVACVLDPQWQLEGQWGVSNQTVGSAAASTATATTLSLGTTMAF